jgi:HEAT repeat protein
MRKLLLIVLSAGAVAAVARDDPQAGSPALPARTHGHLGTNPGAGQGEKSDDDIQTDWYARILTDNKVKTDNASILAYLKRISAHDDDLLNIDKLIEQLGDDDFDKRQDASRRLTDLGPVALPVLRLARNHKDRETARRVRDCSHNIASGCFADLPLAAVHLLIRRKVDGAVELLLSFLPYCMDEDLEWQIYEALEALGCADGKVHPAIEKALHDVIPARRAVAACLIGRLGDEKQRFAVRKLLQDRDPIVRLRGAQGLLAGKDVAAIPTLIELLEGPLFVAWQSEELLRFVAGEQAPRALLLHGGGHNRETCSVAWRNWWQAQEGHIDWKSLERIGRSPRLILACGVRDEQGPRSWEPMSLLSGLLEKWLGPERCSWVALYGADGQMRAQWTAPWDDPWDDPELSHDGVYQVVARRNLEQILICSRKPSREERIGGRIVRDTTITEVGANGAILNRSERHEPPFAVLGPNARVLFEVAELDLPDPPVALGKLQLGDTLRIAFKGWLPNASWGVVLTEGNSALVREWAGIDNGSVSRIEKWHWEHAVPLSSGGWLVIQQGSFFELNGQAKVLWQAAVPRHEENEPKGIGCRCIARMPNGNAMFAFAEEPHRRLMFDMRGDYARTWRCRIAEVNQRGRVVLEFPVLEQVTQVQACFPLIAFGFDRLQPTDFDLRSVPSLIRRLGSSDPRSRQLAASTLHCLTDRAELEKVVTDLAENISPSDSLAAEHIRNLLIQDIPDEGVPALCKALKHAQPGVRRRAIESLGLYYRENGQIAPGSKEAILACLADPDAHVIAGALRALPREAYKSCAPRLRALMRSQLKSDGNPEVFRAAGEALLVGNTASPEVEPILIQALTRPEVRFKRAGAALFADRWKGQLSADARRILLTDFLQETDLELRADALWCLRDITDPPKELLSEVIMLLQRPRLFGMNDELTDAAVTYCKVAKGDTTASVPSLIALLANPREPNDLRRRVGACLIERWGNDKRVRSAFQDVRAALEKAAENPDDQKASGARQLLDDLSKMVKP